jgi:hypothetical protein
VGKHSEIKEVPLTVKTSAVAALLFEKSVHQSGALCKDLLKAQVLM